MPPGAWPCHTDDPRFGALSVARSGLTGTQRPDAEVAGEDLMSCFEKVRRKGRAFAAFECGRDGLMGFMRTDAAGCDGGLLRMACALHAHFGGVHSMPGVTVRVFEIDMPGRQIACDAICHSPCHPRPAQGIPGDAASPRRSFRNSRRPCWWQK